MREGVYRITVVQLPLLCGLAGHNFLVLRAPDGSVLHEMNGLATGRNGAIKPIGYLPSDTLCVYEDDRPRYYRPSFVQEDILAGEYACVMPVWEAGRRCAARINGACLPYPFLGLGRNSNSVVSTLLQAMRLAEPPLAGGARILPGARRLCPLPAAEESGRDGESLRP